MLCPEPFASLAWNAAILPADERRALLDQAAETLPGFQGQARKELRDLRADMIERKLALFNANKRFILSVELAGAEGGYLSVISTAAGSSEMD